MLTGWNYTVIVFYLAFMLGIGFDENVEEKKAPAKMTISFPNGFLNSPGRMIRSKHYKYTNYLEGNSEELYA